MLEHFGKILLLIYFFLLVFVFPAFGQQNDLLRKLKLVAPADPMEAPDFTARTLQGSQVQMKELRGKLVILNFWATWCPPCRLEMPSMEKLYQDFRDQDFEIVAVNFMESPAPISQFIVESNLSYSIVLDPDGAVADAYKVQALPTTFLIGREGRILAKSLGYEDWNRKEARQLVTLVLQDEQVLRSGKVMAAASSSPLWSLKSTTWVWGLASLLAIVGFLVLSKKVGVKRKNPEA